MAVKIYPLTVTTPSLPYLSADGPSKLRSSARRRSAQSEFFRMQAPGGKLGHAEIMIGDSPAMLANEYPYRDALGPRTVGGTPVSLKIESKMSMSTLRRPSDAGAGGKACRAGSVLRDRSGMLRPLRSRLDHLDVHRG